VFVTGGGESLLEQGHQLGVVAGAAPHDPPAVADRRQRELTPQPEPARALGRVQEGCPRGGAVAGGVLGLAEREQQPAARRLVGAIGGVERVHGRPIEARGLLVRELAERAVARPPRVEQGLVEVASGDRMLHEPGDRSAGAVAVEALEQLERPAVQAHAAHIREPLVERVANEDVGEAQPPGRIGRVRRHPRAHGFIEHVEQIVLGQLGKAGQHVERELATEHRSQDEHPPRFARQVRKAARDHLLDALRNGDPDAVR
jgi:hypothetical protein